jgi:hypothetical protein
MNRIVVKSMKQKRWILGALFFSFTLGALAAEDGSESGADKSSILGAQVDVESCAPKATMKQKVLPGDAVEVPSAAGAVSGEAQ